MSMAAKLFVLFGARRILTISPSVSGKTTWDLDIDGPLILPSAGTWTITALGRFEASVKIWGGGGGGGDNGFDYSGPQPNAGLAADSAMCKMPFIAGSTYTAQVGAPGSIATGSNGGGLPGGGHGTYGSLYAGASGGGGGYSALRIAGPGTPIIVAGAGGGRFGGPTGSSLYDGTAGTQVAGGTGGSSGSAFQGADSVGLGSGGGGGGYYGGGAGLNMGGNGGRGSSYIDPNYVTEFSLELGIGGVPGNSADAQRGGGGSPAQPGRIVLN